MNNNNMFIRLHAKWMHSLLGLSITTEERLGPILGAAAGAVGLRGSPEAEEGSGALWCKVGGREAGTE